VKCPGEYFGDFFSGAGLVAKSGRLLGFDWREYDVKHGTEFDLTDRKALNRICRDVVQKRLRGGCFGPPCTSFSIARDRTSRIRSALYPWGLPDLTPHNMIVVKEGNRCLQATIRIILCLHRHKLPWILENPQTSRIWYVTALHNLDKDARVQTYVTDFCRYGAKWRKRTRFMLGNCDNLDAQRLNLKCQTRHFCCETHKAHIQLSGFAPSGQSWTRIAQVYPRKLAKALAHIIVSPDLSRAYNLRTLL
jgi:hypothetical protein